MGVNFSGPDSRYCLFSGMVLSKPHDPVKRPRRPPWECDVVRLRVRGAPHFLASAIKPELIPGSASTSDSATEQLLDRKRNNRYIDLVSESPAVDQSALPLMSARTSVPTATFHWARVTMNRALRSSESPYFSYLPTGVSPITSTLDPGQDAPR